MCTKAKAYFDKVKNYAAQLDTDLNVTLPAGSDGNNHGLDTYSDVDAVIRRRLKKIRNGLKSCPKETENYIREFLKKEINSEMVLEVASWTRANQIAFNTCDVDDQDFFVQRLNDIQIDPCGNVHITTGSDMEAHREAMERLNFALDYAEYLSCAKKMDVEDVSIERSCCRFGNLPASEEYLGKKGADGAPDIPGKLEKYGIEVPTKVIRANDAHFTIPDKLEIDYVGLGGDLMSEAVFTRENIESGSSKKALKAIRSLDVPADLPEDMRKRYQKKQQDSVTDAVWSILDPVFINSPPNPTVMMKAILINGRCMDDILQSRYMKMRADNQNALKSEDPAVKAQARAKLAKFDPGDVENSRKMAADLIVSELATGGKVEILPFHRNPKPGLHEAAIIDPRPRQITLKNRQPKLKVELSLWQRFWHKVLGFYDQEFKRYTDYQNNLTYSIGKLLVTNTQYTAINFADQKYAELVNDKMAPTDFMQKFKSAVQHHYDVNNPDELYNLGYIVQCATQDMEAFDRNQSGISRKNKGQEVLPGPAL